MREDAFEGSARPWTLPADDAEADRRFGQPHHGHSEIEPHADARARLGKLLEALAREHGLLITAVDARWLDVTTADDTARRAILRRLDIEST